MTPGMEIQLIAILISAACALPGVFLVLRKMAMMSDSITHTILLGIVLAFFFTHDLNSPLLIAGAAIMGVITVLLTESLAKTRLVSEEAAIGIVFPLLFSTGIILITRYAGSIHLDTDSVLLGELAFAPFDRMIIFGMDIGAKAIYTSGTLLLINVVFISLFFKELTVVTFDPILAAALGFSPSFIHYGLMMLVSITTVGAFESAGSVLVVAFMIGPSATAYLLTDDLKKMLLLSAGLGSLSGVLGYQLASLFDVSIAGSIAVTIGLLFAVVFLFAPCRGMIAILTKKRWHRLEFAQYALLTYLLNHENKAEKNKEISISALALHLHWHEKKLLSSIRLLQANGRINPTSGLLVITQKGREDYQQFINQLSHET